MFHTTGSNSHTHVELMSDPEHVYLNPTNNTSYGDVVKVNDVGYIKTEWHTGTRTHYLSAFKTYSICDTGECCIEDVEELQQHVETDFISAVRSHPQMNDWEWSYDLRQWNRFPNKSDVGVNMRWAWRTRGGQPGYGHDWQKAYDWQWTDFVYTSPTNVTCNPRGNYWSGRNAPLYGRPVTSMPGVNKHWVDGPSGRVYPEPDSYNVYIRNKHTQKIYPYNSYTRYTGVSQQVHRSNDEQNKLAATAGRWGTRTTSNVNNENVWMRTDFSAMASGQLIIPEPQTATTEHVDSADKVYLNPNNNVIAGTSIMFQGRCYTKTGNTGTMTHLLTAVDTSDLVISEDSIVSPTSGA